MKENTKKTWGEILYPYLTYVMLFLGIGLISGSIVHMSLDVRRYTTLLIIGIILFLAAALINEFIIDKKSLSPLATIRFIFFSLMLSAGVSMISGGIQHFDDVAKYAEYFIPGGVVLSYCGFVFKEKMTFDKRKVIAISILILIFSFGLGVFLKNLAANMPESSEKEVKAIIVQKVI